MNDVWQEAIRIQHEQDRAYDQEQKESRQYDHNEHEPTTFERAQYTAENFREDEEQDIYERDDKLGAI